MVKREYQGINHRGCGKLPVETVEIVENFKCVKKHIFVRYIVQNA